MKVEYVGWTQVELSTYLMDQHVPQALELPVLYTITPPTLVEYQLVAVPNGNIVNIHHVVMLHVGTTKEDDFIVFFSLYFNVIINILGAV